MAVPVTVFNASSQTIAVTVNQGSQFTVLGTGAAQNWAPQPQRSGAGPSFSPGYPAPNVIGNAAPNVIQAYVSGSPIGGGPFTFSLPQYYPVGSVQIFLFFATVQSATLVVLTDGTLAARQIINAMEGEAPPE